MRQGGAGPPRLVASLLLVAFVASSGSVAAQPPTSGRASVYRRPLGNDPATLDPARISDIYGLSVAQQIFDGLVEFDHALRIVPAIAQYWTASRDGLTWTFTLRQGVKFHDGRPVTADDVVYSLTRLLDPQVKSAAADVFASVRGAEAFREGKATTVSGFIALDPSTVRVVLDEAQAPLVSMLAIGYAKIVPRDRVTGRADAFGLAPVGTGPFKFERWERGKEISLVANPDYFGGAPRLGRVVYRVFPGEQFAEMFNEFRRGHLEDSPVPMHDYPKLLATTQGTHVKRTMFSVRFLGLNTRVKPLGDVRVRQALMYAIDRQKIVEEVTRGRFAVARGILPPGTLGYNPQLNSAGYDPARARALLAAAGYPEGRGLPPLTIWSSVKLEREHQLIVDHLAAVGVTADFKYVTEWPEFSRRLAAGQLPMFQYAWLADVPDPDNFLFKLFHSKSPRNYTGYASSALDALLMQARSEPDGQRRVELYRRAEQQVMNDAVVIPFFHYTYERVFQPYVKSIEVSGLGDPYIPLRKIWLEP